jgi:hypothetical protein
MKDNGGDMKGTFSMIRYCMLATIIAPSPLAEMAD